MTAVTGGPVPVIPGGSGVVAIAGRSSAGISQQTIPSLSGAAGGFSVNANFLCYNIALGFVFVNREIFGVIE